MTLTLAAGTGYAVGTPSSATASITDNDGTPTVSVAATDASGAEAASDPIVFTVTRSGNAFTSITVNLTLGGTATAGTDYAVTRRDALGQHGDGDPRRRRDHRDDHDHAGRRRDRTIRRNEEQQKNVSSLVWLGVSFLT